MGNRAMRRAMERQRGKDNRIQAMKREIADTVERNIEKRVDNQKVEALFLCFALALHKELGFGQKRIVRMLDAADREIKPWIDGAAELKDLQEQLIDLTGLKIQVD